MERKLSLIILLISVVLFPHNVEAGGKLQRRKDMMIQQQEQIIRQQQEIQKQQIIQRQREQQQKAIQQQRAAQQRALQQRAIQQKQQQIIRQRQVAIQQRTIQQQKAVARQKAIAQQRALAEQRAIRQRTMQRSVFKQQGLKRQVQQNSNGPHQKEVLKPKEIVTLSQIWEHLETSSEVWGLMMDDTPKVVIVDKYIEWFKQRGISIQNPPIFYVQMLDSMSQDNPEFLKSPFEGVLRTMAIIEYDFNNGRDKDLMAQEELGEEVYQKNKERLGR